MKSPLIRVSQICRRGDRIRAIAFAEMRIKQMLGQCDSLDAMIRQAEALGLKRDPLEVAHLRAEAKGGMH